MSKINKRTRTLIRVPTVCRNAKNYANFKMLKNAGPELNLESDKMGHLIFMGESDSELFSLPYWQERPFSAPFQ